MNRKYLIRKAILTKRRELNLENYQTCSRRISTYISQLPHYKHANTIALYQPIQNEIDITSLLADSNHKFYFPTIQSSNQLKFIEIDKSGQWHTNSFGILEPSDCSKTISPQDIDLMFVPLVAFDPSGTRLGRGKGYYDRTLANARPKALISVGYEFQKQEDIPSDPWDIPVDEVITEQNHYFCKEKLWYPIIG